MDRRSWLWRRKSSEKSAGETESCGSVSSYSERCSEDQELSRASPNPAQSLEVSSNVASCEDGDTMKSLTDKLASALLDIRAKEGLVSQHAKVAEEAVSGWEMAEKEVISLRRQLETATQKNSTLEERINQLDGALKECARQLRQTRQEQEQKLQDFLDKKTREWESEKFEYESRLVQLQVQLEAAKEIPTSATHGFQLKLGAMEKENDILRSELLARSEELDVRTLERDLSNRAAEAASKQHLESTKKVAKLEAECRMLHAMARRSSQAAHKPRAKSVLVGSHGDSDSRERSLQSDHGLSPCKDVRSSALIAEFGQFKPGNTAISMEIDLMDDFLEMEKLVALPETNSGGSLLHLRVDHCTDDTRINSSLEADLRASLERISELEKSERKMEAERAEMERRLTEAQDRLKNTSKQLEETELKLADLRGQLRAANDSRLAAEIAAKNTEAQRKLLESQLESADLKAEEQHEMVALLEAKIEEERVLSAELASKCRDLGDQLSNSKREAEAQRQLLQTQLESAGLKVQELDQRITQLEEKAAKERVLSVELAAKCQNLEDQLSERKREDETRRAAFSNGEFKIKQEKELAVAAKKFAECQDTIASISQQLKSLATLDELVLHGGHEEADTINGSASPQVSKGDRFREVYGNIDASDSITSDSSSGLPPASAPSSSSSSFQDSQHLSLKVR